MAGPAAHAVEDLLLDILAPTRSCRGIIICDCCRQARRASDYDEDGFGICCDCLASDALLVELDANMTNEPAAQGGPP
ncbi:hypothetical protein [Rhizobium laguerreae]|uniref:hypothetical protein n=1 Tax=Rhizobium laguerreae TaxID=1076926 RepID=UPI001C9218B1|nr:hypothetical protein [Rhizobium laguerreae]MBY3206860.1 hypothetical protein [Rhizobium laguerreae]